MATVVSLVTPFGLSFTPISFQGPPPQPRAPVMDLTPAEKAAKQQHDKQQMYQERDVRFQAKQQEQKKKTGFFNKLQAGLDDLSHSIEKGFENTTTILTKEVTTMNDDHAFNRFRKAFPQFAQEELLLDQRCKLLSLNGTIPGFLQVSNSRLCFVAENQITFSVPLNEILSVQLARSAPTGDGHMNILPIHDDRTQATAIQIFTCGGQLLPFFDFWSIAKAMAASTQCINDTLNILDHQWRKCVQVPRTDIQYIPYQQFVMPTWTPSQPVQLQQQQQQQPATQQAQPNQQPPAQGQPVMGQPVVGQPIVPQDPPQKVV